MTKYFISSSPATLHATYCVQGCPPLLYDIMLECWHKDPIKRPTFETLQWKLEDFFTMSDSDYKEASAY
jgi:fyn-related kinase